MRKEKNGFISNPTLLITLTIFVVMASCLLIGMIVNEYRQLIKNPLLTLTVILLLFIIFFLLLLINKFKYKIYFDDLYLYQYKGMKLINKFSLDKITMSFLNPKYNYVNIEGINSDDKRVVLSFEYSKTRGKIISKFFQGKIDNLPKRFE